MISLRKYQSFYISQLDFLYFRDVGVIIQDFLSAGFTNLSRNLPICSLIYFQSCIVVLYEGSPPLSLSFSLLIETQNEREAGYQVGRQEIN